ncbi:MAG TPA: biotin carboxylase N-terminal domain-containing protein [Candidatus Limnocylindria bacterium]|nr:biotin carboxylase N-terminal domain-containing protein [Candidatus Limnocylindria bacterium]
MIRTCRELGLATVAVHSDADRTAPHVRLADEAYAIGTAAARDSYLRIDRILEVAKRARADAVHPGYGFLSENADFAQAVADAGIAFVGPPASVQRALGEKTAARRLATSLGVPVAEGTMEPVTDERDARVAADRVGYPVLLKPAGGGGGKGMRVVRSAAELAAAWRGATGEALGAFGTAGILVERYLEGARHVEVQLIADRHGSVVALGERDCSIQRRHQKLVEETPGPSVDGTLRARLFDAATKIARAARYESAGTAEFLVGRDGRVAFLEVNTRLQVEHPVTEMVTGADLVALQLLVAAGGRLPFAQADVRPRGAAIECRITAEDAYAGFVPQAGRVTILREPSGPGVRVDGALEPGSVVPSEYDPLLAKIVAWGATRGEAVARARRAIRETTIGGIPTTQPFHLHVLGEPDFVAGRYDTSYVATHWPPPEPALQGSALAAAALVATLARRAAPAPRVDDDGAWSRAAREEALR